jgi:UDP-N-acetylglucosamine 2-epimerase (non-hydrolysing)
MPEETNRRITDHISDHLFAPTQSAARNAMAEGIHSHKIKITGNTIVDALKHMEPKIDSSTAGEDLGLNRGEYFLTTVHRQENVDCREKFESILAGLSRLYEKFGTEIVYPVHPRSRKLMGKFGLSVPKGVTAVEPTGYVDFLFLEKNAALILTDSGGVQEEACIFDVPCVTLRENTERPETVEIGANMIAGTDPEKIEACAGKMLGKNGWQHPFGHEPSRKIADAIKAIEQRR